MRVLCFNTKMADTRELTALVVDDEPVVANLLRQALSRIPYLNVKTSENGQEAYSIIGQSRPDILYTDIVMPSMSGDILLKKLVQEGYNIPTFVISATSTDEQGVRAIYYSHRMFTQQQAGQLLLPISPTIDDTKNFIEGEKLNVDHQRQTDETLKYDFGFNVLTKPYDLQELLYKTQIIQAMLQNPQS